eukprot:3731047-Heterocapsa_arctica.AAC.1
MARVSGRIVISGSDRARLVSTGLGRTRLDRIRLNQAGLGCTDLYCGKLAQSRAEITEQGTQTRERTTESI